MEDAHQINTIIATAICDFLADCPDGHVDVEGAKLLAKQIVDALAAAGLRIVMGGETSA